MDNLLRLSQAAKLFGVTERTLVNWDRAGKLRTVRTQGNQRRVPQTEISRLLADKAMERADAGRVYIDKVAGVVGFVLRDMVLEMFCMGCISELYEVAAVEGGTVYVKTDRYSDDGWGDEFDLVWAGALLGFTEQDIRSRMKGITFYTERQVA